MSAALSVFKLSVQSVCQLQQHRIKVSFEMTGLSCQWTPVAIHSFRINSTTVFNSVMLVGFGIQHPSITPTSQFNYLFTLKNAHLSSNSYNFWMQRNISMKFAQYVAQMLHCKHYKFCGKKLPQWQRYRIFPRGYFFGAPYSRLIMYTRYNKMTMKLRMSSRRKFGNSS